MLIRGRKSYHPTRQPRPELTPAPQPLVILPFSISIYTKEEPVYRYLSASMLRSFLNKIFSL